MTRFVVADDGHGEPTVFRALGSGDSEMQFALFRRCDLPALPDRDQIWEALALLIMRPSCWWKSSHEIEVGQTECCGHPLVAHGESYR